MAYRQVMSDSFSVHVTGPYHCGPNHDTPKNFAYQIIIEYPSDVVLTPEGFLLDNLCAREFFSNIGTTDLSCEQLAQYSARYFADKCLESNLSWTSITACIEALPGKARIEYILSASHYFDTKRSEVHVAYA